MAKKDVGGYPSIFRNKKGGGRVQGVLTKVGTKAFEDARKRLGTLAGVKRATDADTIEYMSRGHEATVLYLQGGVK